MVECQKAASKQRHDAAIDYCTRAIKLDPNFSEAHVVRGTAYLFLNDYDKRHKDHEKAVTLFQSQGYHQEAKDMKKIIRQIAKFRKENAQN